MLEFVNKSYHLRNKERVHINRVEKGIIINSFMGKINSFVCSLTSRHSDIQRDFKNQTRPHIFYKARVILIPTIGQYIC
jgi:hypothetical protein